MTANRDYWLDRRASNYFRVVRSICDTMAENARTVLDVGSRGTPILEWRRASARRMVSIDLQTPYTGADIESITGDFMHYRIEEPFDLVTCLQVLEHVDKPAAFARKLLTAGRLVVVSVPYKWPKGSCDYHIHDPVDERCMEAWFGRPANSQYVVPEASGEQRLIQVYRTVAETPRLAAVRRIPANAPLQVRVVHRAQRSTHDWPLFTLVRNEAKILPHFLRHYRSLGIDHFFIYDDQSTDETPALLRGQPDCTLLSSPHRFGDVCGETATGAPKRFCSLIRESLPIALIPQGWAAVVDVDEFMILPPGIDTLPQMCRLLDARGQAYATAPMIDFYPERFAAPSPTTPATPFEACPYFDAGPLYEWNGTDIIPRHLSRGLRARLHRVVVATNPWVVEHVCGSRQPEWMAKCWKVPLLKHGNGITRLGDHEISVPPATTCDVALAHFKFLPGFESKITSAIADAQYYAQSVEYRFLQAALAIAGCRSLLGPESRRYSGPESLVAAQLLQPIQSGGRT